MGSVSPDPLGAGSISLDPKDACSVSPDLEATGSIPVDIYRIGETHMKEKKDPTTLEAFFSLVLLLFLLCNSCFPFAYKRGSRTPQQGEGQSTRDN